MGLAHSVGSPGTEAGEVAQSWRASTPAVDSIMSRARTLVEIRSALQDKLQVCADDIRVAMRMRYDSTCRQLEAIEREIGADALRTVTEQVEQELQSALHG